jgi:hypothetical protein
MLVGVKRGRLVESGGCSNWEIDDKSTGCNETTGQEFDDRWANHAWSRWLLRTVQNSGSSFVLLELHNLTLVLIVLQGALIRDCHGKVM